jgi:hypothetical protein
MARLTQEEHYEIRALLAPATSSCERLDLV